MRVTPTVLVFLAVAQTAAAQQKTSVREGERAPLDRDREIALARSAAPAAVSKDATVFVLSPDGYKVAHQGTNGAACYVSRSWQESVEPHCYNAEGAATIMPMEMRRVELYQKGVPYADVKRAITESLSKGEFRLPRRPAVSYMMSGAQVLYDDEGRFVGSWRPHLMIFVPFMTNEEIGMSGSPDIRAAIVNEPGTPEANLMVIVKEFIEPAAATKRP